MDRLLARLPALVAEHQVALARCRADAASLVAADRAIAARLEIFAALQRAGWIPPPGVPGTMEADRFLVWLTVAGQTSAVFRSARGT